MQQEVPSLDGGGSQDRWAQSYTQVRGAGQAAWALSSIRSYLEGSAWYFEENQKVPSVRMGAVGPREPCGGRGRGEWRGSSCFSSSTTGLMVLGKVGLPGGSSLGKLPHPHRQHSPPSPAPCREGRGQLSTYAVQLEGHRGWRVGAAWSAPGPGAHRPSARLSHREKQLVFILWALGNSLCSFGPWKSALNPK